MTMRSKYIKPKSVAWWASVAPLFGGVVVSLSPVVPELQPIATVVDTASGGLSAPVLINLGLIGIGLRGAQT